MKQLIFIIGIGCIWLLTACQNEISTFTEQSDKVTLSFDLYTASLTKAGNAISNIGVGKKFRVYAYEKGSTTDTTPVAYGEYIVAQGTNDIMTTAPTDNPLALYRGVYDLYLVSYNDDTYIPELGSNNRISVSNDKDLIYTTLKNITVQPQKAGEANMKISLTDPFTHLCSNVVLKVASNTTQPVQLATLKVLSVTIENLSSPLNYQLGKDENNWYKPDKGEKEPSYDQSMVFDKFTTVGSVTDFKVDSSRVVLPLNGSSKLNFDVGLLITYDRDHTSDITKFVTEEFHYQASVRKAMLPGMTYLFQFTLTFFGALDPTDLTLGILEYTTVSDKTDDVGL